MKRLFILVLVFGFFSTAVGAGERARIDNIKTEWQNAYGAIIYTVLADIMNLSDAPIQYVRVKVELLDKDGHTVAQRMGYNVGAEVLEVVVEGEGEEAAAPEDRLKQVKAIAPGASDLVRISLDKVDIGQPFRKTNVSLVEVR